MEKSIFLDRPNIVVSVVDATSLNEVSTFAKPCPWDVVEIRIDQLQSVTDLKGQVEQIASPVLLTCRHPEEGGEKSFADPQKRHSAFSPLIPYAAAIDIEIAHAEEMGKTLEEARSTGIQIVLSAHDFKGTPETQQLQSLVNTGFQQLADVVKIATTTEQAKDVSRLLQLFDFFDSRNLALMGMGRLGMASRLLAAQCGSVLNYSSPHSATVPGQWQASEFRSILNVAEESRSPVNLQ